MVSSALLMMDCMLTTEATILIFQAFDNLNVSRSMNINFSNSSK
jgi:hypothetical protein